MEAKIKTTNRLWQARHRAGLEQKQVANLLGHKTCDQVSRYERGDRLPSLNTALKLAIVLRVSIRELFPELFEDHRARIAETAAKMPSVLPLNGKTAESLTGAHHCTFEVLILQTAPTDDEINLARKHSVALIRNLGEVIGRRRIQ